MGLGDIFNGFTVVEITADKAVIKNEEEEITVLLLEDELDEKRQNVNTCGFYSVLFCALELSLAGSYYTGDRTKFSAR